MVKCECSDMVRVRPDIEPSTCPISAECAGRIGIVDDVHVDSDGDTAALVWFGEPIPRLHNDSCWIYLENLEEV